MARNFYPTRHMESHARDNPYCCTGKKNYLQDHPMKPINSHAGKNSYPFDLCGKKFISGKQIKRHMKRTVITVFSMARDLSWDAPFLFEL